MSISIHFFLWSDSGKTYSIIDLFLNGKELVLVSMNVGTCFLVNTLVYYGVERGMRLIIMLMFWRNWSSPLISLSYNAAALPGNLYVNNAINGLVELLAYLLCVALLDRLGRKAGYFLKLQKILTSKSESVN